MPNASSTRNDLIGNKRFMCFYARSPAAAVVSIRGISKKANWRYKSVCHSSPFVHCVYLSKLETVNASTSPETIQKKAEKRISVNCHPANVCRSLNNIFWKTEKSVGKTFYFCVSETGKIQFYLCNTSAIHHIGHNNNNIRQTCFVCLAHFSLSRCR